MINRRQAIRARLLFERYSRDRGDKREWLRIAEDEQRCWLVLAALPGTLMPEPLTTKPRTDRIPPT